MASTASDKELATPHVESGIPLTDIDRELLAMKDEDFKPITWNDLKRIILETNALEELKRTPSDLRRYVRWSAETKVKYGSIMAFVLRERLHWTPQESPTTTSDSATGTTAPAAPTFTHHSDVPFADERDYQILLNDWPYGLAPGIAHIVVWSRTPIAVDDREGDVTPESRAVIEAFVRRAFVEPLLGLGHGREDGGFGGEERRDHRGTSTDRVLWFKNWVSLQSVRGVDHIHVLVRDAPKGLLEAWTTPTADRGG